MPAMGPRANFECRHCQVTYPDLPVESVRCPVCSFKRGFRRLFDAVQIAGGQQHARAEIVDRVAIPEIMARNEIRESAQRYNAMVAQMQRNNDPLTQRLSEMGRAITTPAATVQQGNIRYHVPNVSGIIAPDARAESSQRNIGGFIKQFRGPRPGSAW